MSGGCCTAVRIGAAPAAAKAPEQPKIDPVKQAKAGSARQSCSDITGTGSGGSIDCPEPKKRQFEQPKQTAKEAYGPPKPQDDPAVALIGRILEESRKAPPVELKLAPSAPAAQPAPQQKADSPERAASIRDADTYLRAAYATETNDRSCAGWRTAAENYRIAGKFLLRADLIDRANEALDRSTALEDAVDKAERESKCGSRQARVATPGGKPQEVGELKGPQCKEAIDHLRKAAGPDMRSLGEKGPKGSHRQETELVVLKIELAARGCVDPISPVTDYDCIRASAHLIDVIPNEEKVARLKAAGCKVGFREP